MVGSASAKIQNLCNFSHAQCVTDNQTLLKLKSFGESGRLVFIHTAEISNLRDFPRPRPTLLQVWMRRGGGEEEKHSSCQADGLSVGLVSDSGNKIFAWYTKPMMSGAIKGLQFLSLMSALMTYCNVPTYPGVKRCSLWTVS